MANLQYASCLDNSNHTEAGRVLPSIWTLFCCQSAQKIVRYRCAGAFPYCLLKLEGRSFMDGKNNGASLQSQGAGQQAAQGDQAAQQ